MQMKTAVGIRYLLGGCVVALLSVVPFAAQDDGPSFTSWGQASGVGPPIMVDWNWEGCPFISKSGLDLYFRTLVYNSQLDNWFWDIFVSHRDTVDDPWETPINLGPKINTAASNELCSFVTIDGHWIYFVSNRPGSYGGTDLWVSHRKDKRDDQGWETPKNLGPLVNGATGENGPSVFEDEVTGRVTLYFTRVVSGKNKIFSCELLDKETVGPAALVEGLNATGYADWHAFVRRRDGLEVIFCSDRPGTLGMADLWVSTRRTTADPWSAPVNLGPLVNSPRGEGRPSISWDGTTLFFWTDREYNPGGWWDVRVYQTTRSKARH